MRFAERTSEKIVLNLYAIGIHELVMMDRQRQYPKYFQKRELLFFHVLRLSLRLGLNFLVRPAAGRAFICG